MSFAFTCLLFIWFCIFLLAHDLMSLANFKLFDILTTDFKHCFTKDYNNIYLKYFTYLLLLLFSFICTKFFNNQSNTLSCLHCTTCSHRVVVIFTQSYSMPNAMLPSVDQFSSCSTKTRHSRT